jgi:hypothetical protein
VEELPGLAGVLAAEYAVIYGYGVAGAALVRAQPSPSPLAVGAARSGLDAHRTERDLLLEALARDRTPLPPAQAAYALPFPLVDAAAALRLLALLEERLCGICAPAVGQVERAADRLLLVDVLTAAAVRRMQLRRVAGLSVAASVTAFPGAAGA